MKKSWQNTIIAAACAMGVAVTTAEGSPAETSWESQVAAAQAAQTAAPTVLGQNARPTEAISPFRNPVKYMGAAFSEMPLPRWAKRDKPATIVKSKAKKDSISLDTPTGPPSPQLIVSLAQISEQKGDVAGARLQYQKALAMWPGQVDVLRAAARMEDRLGGLQLAESLYQQAAIANPQHAGAHNDFGICLARQGKLDQSVQEIEQAINLQPENALYRNNAATVLIMVRQDQRALAHLSAAHGGAAANYNMGQLLVQRGRAMDATPYFVTALEIDPTMQAAQVALASLQGQVVGAAPTMVSEPRAPMAAPAIAPQQAPAGPELSFPATASNPAWNSSSYVPPGYYAPTGQIPPQAQPRVSQAPPRYLPPVPPGPQQQLQYQPQAQPGTVLR